MNRIGKLYALLEIAPSVGAEFDIPKAPPRYVALEQDCEGNTLWAYFSPRLDQLRDALAGSETHFVNQVRIHDLDTDAVLVPVWKVTRFTSLEDKFSYTEGYATVS